MDDQTTPQDEGTPEVTPDTTGGDDTSMPTEDTGMGGDDSGEEETTE